MVYGTLVDADTVAANNLHSAYIPDLVVFEKFEETFFKVAEELS